MTDLIMLFIILTIIVICVIACDNKRIKIKKYHEKLNSVVPGTLLVRYYNDPNTPFRSSVRHNSSIKILEVKKNTTDEIWIKYAYEDISDTTKYVEDYPFYDTLENKLQLYPNIVLPK